MSTLSEATPGTVSSNTLTPVPVECFPPIRTDTIDAAIHPIPSTPQIPELSTHIEEPLSCLFSDTQEGEVIHATSTFNTPDDSPCICSIPETCKSTSEVSLIHENPLPSESEMISSIQHQTITFPDVESISSEQCKDPILSEIISWVQSDDCPKIQVNRTPAALVVLWKQFNLLSYERGLLLRKLINTKDSDTPRSLMKHEFTEYIATCTTCQETKQSHHFLHAPLKQLIFHHFNDCIMVDHIVPEQEGRTPRGFRFILSITDCFSYYLVAVLVKSQTSKENIKAIFRNWVITFGMPKELIVHNHPGFTS